MIEALYGVEFESNMNDAGYGVVVLETERILGGDSSFVFVGNYKLENGIIKAEVKCTKFGDIDEFTLSLSGKPQRNEFILQGYMIENPAMKIGIKLTRRAELP